MMAVMLAQLDLEGWKSFERASVPLGPLTLLVGANASGKSNFVDALRFLEGLAKGLEVRECVEGPSNSSDDWEGVRGGLSELAFRDTDQLMLSAVIGDVGTKYRHSLWVAVSDAQITRETLTCEGETDAVLLEATPETHTVDGATRKLRQTRLAGGQTLWANRDTTVSTVHEFARFLQSFDLKSPEAMKGIEGVHTLQSRLRCYDPQPDALRDLSGLTTGPLERKGWNLSAVLRELCNDAERKQTLVDWVSELCAPRVVDLDFIEVKELRNVMVVLVEEDGTRVPARAMSDGTLRFLAILAAVLSAEPGSTLVFEEIETGLHPTRLHLLLELLERQTKARGIQVIATTHSPTALRELSREALADVVVFARNPDARGTVASRLGNLPRFEELAKSRGVEHLFTTGWLERALSS